MDTLQGGLFDYENTFSNEKVQISEFRFVIKNNLLRKFPQFLSIIYLCRIKILGEQVQWTQTADHLPLRNTDTGFHFGFLDQMKLKGMLCILSQGGFIDQHF